MKGQTFSADLLTKMTAGSINPAVFRVIDAKWGPHTIDRFALHYNVQVPRFYSKFASPCCSGVDALSQDWRDENNWVCSPVSAILPSVRALSLCSGYGTLIVPQWPSAYFWPFCMTALPSFLSLVKGVFKLSCIEDPLVGRSRPEANLQVTSLGLQWLLEIQNVSLTG